LRKPASDCPGVSIVNQWAGGGLRVKGEKDHAKPNAFGGGFGQKGRIPLLESALTEEGVVEY